MEIKQATLTLGALAQETRLAIFRLLVQAGPTGLAVGQIGHKLELANATLSFHLKELASAGLVSATPRGRFIDYSANFATMNELLAYLTEHCCGGVEICEMPVVKPSGKKAGAANSLASNGKTKTVTVSKPADAKASQAKPAGKRKALTCC